MLLRIACLSATLLGGAQQQAPPAAPAAASVDDELSVVVERYGFRLQRPDDSWISYAEAPQQAGAAYTLTLYPRDSGSLPSVVVYVADHDGTASAEDVRAAGARVVESQGNTILERSTRTLAGRTALSLRGRAAAGDGPHYDFEIHYLVVAPFVYALQCNWATDAPRPEVFDPLIDSFALFPAEVPEARAEDSQLAALAQRCGSELPWSADWTAAAARARSEGKLVLVVFESYPTLDLPHTLATGPLIDTDLLALIEERFVPLRMSAADPAPFREPGAFELGPHTWGGAVLFVTPGGDVLDDVGASNTFLIADRARQALDRAGPRRGGAVRSSERAPHDPDERLAQAGVHLRRGELAEAQALLAHVESPQGHALREVLYRQQRDGERALEEVAAARRGSDPELAADLAVEEGVLLMRLGLWTESGTALHAALQRFPDGPRAGEAQFWLGAMDMLQHGAPHGTQDWRALVAARPDDRWAWKAAANLLGSGSFVNAGERLEWPGLDAFAAIASAAPARLDASRADQAEHGAIAYLLASQRTDGSWICPTDAFSVAPTGYTFAITALCGSSLLPSVARDGDAEQAVQRAIAYLLAMHQAGQLAGGTDLAGVYSIWGRAFVLRFLAQCRSAHLGDDAQLAPVVTALVQSVLDGQAAGGGWPYVILPGAPERGGLDPSASFLTAGVLLALLDARAAGAAVPQEPIDHALAFLQAMRRDDGSFRYMRDVPEAADNPEAAGRGPVCALAVHRAGRRDVPALRKALDQFLTQRDGMRRLWGKDLCHTGPEGQGVHYLFFDYAFAAAAVAELPHGDRARYRKPLLQDVLDQRDAEGAFTDMPSLGRAYGTAMALFTFQQLRAR